MCPKYSITPFPRITNYESIVYEMEYDSQHSIHTPFELEYGWSFCKYTPSHNRNENQRIMRTDGIMECFCMKYVFLSLLRSGLPCLKAQSRSP